MEQILPMKKAKQSQFDSLLWSLVSGLKITKLTQICHFQSKIEPRKSKLTKQTQFQPKQERDGGLSLRDSRPISHVTDLAPDFWLLQKTKQTQTYHLKLPPLSFFLSFRVFRGKKTKRTQFPIFQSKIYPQGIEPRKSKITKRTQIKPISWFPWFPGPSVPWAFSSWGLGALCSCFLPYDFCLDHRPG
jgi:hypothetical protein